MADKYVNKKEKTSKIIFYVTPMSCINRLNIYLKMKLKFKS